ncbi:putative type II secretion system protein F [Pelotomaculum schinkii]|uniref:Putative type II secretion system protein F n=1 Tax=Pelotomaculum schinkii TaxID=78350 RepID=A0A4Y7R7M6_9FIRM|nr:type II secretion system F family protein [Pelotomaculum schinkii]TEB04723.1 putative type II secretion system protein F [Pelotomaculum schinkii]
MKPKRKVLLLLYTVTGYIDSETRDITVQAYNETEAVNQVKRKFGEDRIMILRVNPASSPALTFLQFKQKVNSRELEFFCRQMHALIAAGVTMLESLNAIADQTDKKFFKSALLDIADNIRDGLSLSGAFQKHSNIFPPVFCSMVAAAEETGALDDAMNDLAEHFAGEARFWGRMRQATAYPAIVTGLSMLEVLVLFTFVVPKFADFLTSENVPLPASTRLLLFLSARFNLILPAAIACFFIFALIFKKMWQDEKFRYYMEQVFVRIPVIGRLMTRAAAARVCRTLSLMIRVGVPVTSALAVTARVSGFTSFKREIQMAQEGVREGQRLCDALKKSRWLPSISLKMIAVGENSGRLDKMLNHAAALFEVEMEMMMQKIPTIAEASLIIVVGGIVLFILIAVYTPIFSIYQAIH